MSSISCYLWVTLLTSFQEREEIIQTKEYLKFEYNGLRILDIT